jgi:hypothetical protein
MDTSLAPVGSTGQDNPEELERRERREKKRPWTRVEHLRLFSSRPLPLVLDLCFILSY